MPVTFPKSGSMCQMRLPLSTEIFTEKIVLGIFRLSDAITHEVFELHRHCVVSENDLAVLYDPFTAI